MAWGRPKLSLSSKNERYARIWNLIFKNGDWINQILQLQGSKGNPVPCLVGRDLKKLYHGKSKGIYLALLIHDETGDAKYITKSLFESLQEHEYDENKSEIRLKGSDIVLHIHDAIGSSEWVEMKDPSRLFHGRRAGLSTRAMYYTENAIHKIGPDLIGGIEGVSLKKAVREICSIRLKSRDGSPVYHVLISSEKSVRVVNIQVQDEERRKWVARWRLARPNEREWFP